MTESSVLSEIEACAMAYHLCVLPRNPRRLYCSVWDMPDVGHHAGVLWRSNIGGVTASYKGRERFVRFGLAGLADFTGFLFRGGQRVEIEAKCGTGRLSPSQESFSKLCGNAGVLWGLVRSYAECEVLFQKWGLKRAGDGEGRT